MYAFALASLLALVPAAPPAGAPGVPAATCVDDEPIEVSIEYLTSIEWKQGDDLPKDIQDLDGKKVTITGYMALGTTEGATKFELVPEACECGRSKVNHFIDVTIKDGGATYKPGRIDLVGTFSAGELEEDGFVVSLFRLEIETFD